MLRGTGSRRDAWLPAATTVAGVDLELGGFTTDYPRDLAVEVAREDGSWMRLAAEVVLAVTYAAYLSAAEGRRVELAPYLR